METGKRSFSKTWSLTEGRRADRGQKRGFKDLDADSKPTRPGERWYVLLTKREKLNKEAVLWKKWNNHVGTSSSQLETLVQRSHFFGTSGQDLEMNKITKKNFTTTSIKVVVILLRESGNLSVLAPSPLISYCGRGVFGHVCWSKNMFSTFHTPRACSHPPSYPMPRWRTIDIKKEEQRAEGQPSIFKPEDNQWKTQERMVREIGQEQDNAVSSKSRILRQSS